MSQLSKSSSGSLTGLELGNLTGASDCQGDGSIDAGAHELVPELFELAAVAWPNGRVSGATGPTRSPRSNHSSTRTASSSGLWRGHWPDPMESPSLVSEDLLTEARSAWSVVTATADDVIEVSQSVVPVGVPDRRHYGYRYSSVLGAEDGPHASGSPRATWCRQDLHRIPSRERSRRSGAPRGDIGVQPCCHQQPAGSRGASSRREGLKALDNRSLQVVAGTAWAFAREDFREQFDFLVLDEAGQMSLANTAVCAMAAKNLVMFGDPQQLQQPLKGTHPEGAEVSALRHLLADSATVDQSYGVLLDVSYRMHPELCSAVSDLSYDGRLSAAAVASSRALEDIAPGLQRRDVDHAGNRQSSPEEVEAVVALFADLLARVFHFEGLVSRRRISSRPSTTSKRCVSSACGSGS